MRWGLAGALLLALQVLGTPQPRAQAPTAPTINVARIVLVEPGSETPLPIQVGPPASIPAQSFLRIRGLPPTAALTEGYAIAPGAWAVPLAGLAMLRIRAPKDLSGRSELTVTLVDVDGHVLREEHAALVLASGPILTKPPEPAPRPAAEAPAAPAPPLPEHLAQQFNEALRMLTKGDDLIVAGNVALARLYYQRAADMGLARGALALAGTYDAEELARRNVVGVQPEPDLARQWYERARELGAPEAAARLSRLGAKQ